MCRYLTGLLAVVVFVSLASPTTAAPPELKPGVRLTLSGTRLAGWASPDVVDWNNDGLNDLVIGHSSGELSVHLNRGLTADGIQFERAEIQRQDGLRSAGSPIWAWRFNKVNCICPGPGRISPRVVDWDNDGKKDLVIGDGQGAQTRIWRNVGTDQSPEFSTHHIQYLPPDAGVRPYHETVNPCIADWNGDGNRDLLMGRNRGVYVYINQGTDTAPEFDFDNSRLGTKIRDLFPTQRLSPVLLDWDGDGAADLLVGTEHGEVWFAKNVGSKTAPAFKDYAPVLAGGKSITVESDARIAVADLDGDGLRDLVVGASNGVVRFYQARQSEPIARSQYLLRRRGSSAKVVLVGTDDQDRALEYRILTRPKHGTLSGTPPDLTYTPEPNYERPDAFSFCVAMGKSQSSPAVVTLDVEPQPTRPAIQVEPLDALIGVGQPIQLAVTASGTPPLKYEWLKDGKPIAGATGPTFSIRESVEADEAVYSVTVSSALGSILSRGAAILVEPLPTKSAYLPVVDIAYKSPVIEPATPGVLVITRKGDLTKPVNVQLTSRTAHHPVVADVHYVPVPTSVRLGVGQTTAEVQVMPIDDTLVNGTQSLTFQIVPNPAYRLASNLSLAKMIFLDDDCPNVGIHLIEQDTRTAGGEQTFQVTAQPAPRRDTEITYSVGGTATPGVDYRRLTGKVTIPAGQTTANVVVQPYRPAVPAPPSSAKKTVVLTLPLQPFTYFEFYPYLTDGRPRTATAQIAALETSPRAPSAASSKIPENPGVNQLRGEVAQLGWILFSAYSDGEASDLDLFVMRPDGSDLRNLTNTPEFDEFSARAAPDGKRFLYRRTKKTPRVPITTRLPQNVGAIALNSWPATGTLVLANTDGSKLMAVEKEGDFAWASWSPDGKQLACLEEVVRDAAVADNPTKKNAKPPEQRIIIRDAETLDVVQELRARSIHSQAIWSPDGRRILGQSNVPPGKERQPKGVEYPLGRGKMVSVDVQSGKVLYLSHFPDWYPAWATDADGDWFQGGSPQVLHSANNYGICPAYYPMLWRSGLDEKASQLVFGEFKKHVWGGCSSPNDQYAVFVIASDPWPLLGKMAIIRLADAPLARGESKLFHEVLADHFPKLKQGPILDLSQAPAGFDPHWTQADFELKPNQGK